MLILIFVSLTLKLALGQGMSPQLDPEKFTVCAITINSDDEKKVFQDQVKRFPNKFNPVVELTEFGDSDWFSKACSSGIQCDQLVVSGHFGGSFFGTETDKTLSMVELEEAGCQKTCEGVLSRPYEVFLFGCNTLAERDSDHRTPDQYLQVLLADGLPPQEAELVVQSRYGVVGDSFKASMQRAFSGENKNLYGFDSVGPSGKNVKGFLKKYFDRISAPEQVERLQARRLLDKLDSANQVLASSLRTTAFAQCEASALDEQSKKVCALIDSEKTLDEKLDLIVELLAQENALVFLPAISKLFNEKIRNDLTPSQLEIITPVRESESIKTQLLGLIQKTNSIGLKQDWSHLAHKLGYISRDEAYQIIHREIVKPFSRKITSQELEEICQLDLGNPPQEISNDEVTVSPLTSDHFWAIDCLRMQDPALAKRLFAIPHPAGEEGDYMRSVLFNEYGKHLALDSLPPWFHAQVIKELRSESPHTAIELAEKFYPQDRTFYNEALKLLGSPSLESRNFSYLIRYFRDSPLRNPEFSTSFINALKKRPESFMNNGNITETLSLIENTEQREELVLWILKNETLSNTIKEPYSQYFRENPPLTPSVSQRLRDL